MRHVLPIAVVLGFICADAAAATPPAFVFSNGGACPETARVRDELQQLLPGAVMEARSNAINVEITDMAASYKVFVLGRERIFSDNERNCEARARAAAAFVFLVVAPPNIAEPLAAPTVRPAPIVPIARPAVSLPKKRVNRRHGPGVELALAGVFASAPRSSPNNDLYAGGAALRLILRSKYVGGTLGIAGLSPTTQQFSAGKVQLWREPLDISARAVLPFRRLELAADLGIAFTILHAQGVGLVDNSAGTRLAPGLRAATEIRYWIAPRFALTAGVQAVVNFETYGLSAIPVGLIGTAPRIWIDTQLGFAVRAH